MYSVVITHKRTGKAVAQVPVSIHGQNYAPTPEEYHAEAWRAATDDGLVSPDADKLDYAFETLNVSMRDVLSPDR